jgi:hypothetical protein
MGLESNRNQLSKRPRRLDIHPSTELKPQASRHLRTLTKMQSPRM